MAVAICDPVHDVEAIFHLLTESGNLFLKYHMSDACEIANCRFTGITQIFVGVDWCSG